MTLAEILKLAPVVPVLIIEEEAHAVPLAKALVAGGLYALEVTLRTPAALEAISAMKKVKGAIVGAGTVLNPDMLEQAIDAGSEFIVSPGLTKKLGKAAINTGIPVLPGVANAGDIMRGLDMGLDRFKFFPAETSGGAPALKALSGPLPHITFCPTGGVTPQNAGSYLSLPNVICVGSSWVASGQAMADGDWAGIEARAREASQLRKG